MVSTTTKIFCAQCGVDITDGVQCIKSGYPMGYFCQGCYPKPLDMEGINNLLKSKSYEKSILGNAQRSSNRGHHRVAGK